LYQRTALNSDMQVENPTETDEIIRSVEEPESEEPLGSDSEEDEEQSEEPDVNEELEEEGNDSFSVVEVGTGNSPTSTLEFQYSGDSVNVTLNASDRSYVELK